MNKRKDNLEFRWEENRFPEIVCWNTINDNEDDFCYTVAMWKLDKEGWNLEFLGRRPFNEGIQPKLFWELSHYGQKIVDASFDFDYYAEGYF